MEEDPPQWNMSNDEECFMLIRNTNSVFAFPIKGKTVYCSCCFSVVVEDVKQLDGSLKLHLRRKHATKAEHIDSNVFKSFVATVVGHASSNRLAAVPFDFVARFSLETAPSHASESLARLCLGCGDVTGTSHSASPCKCATVSLTCKSLACEYGRSRFKPILIAMPEGAQERSLLQSVLDGVVIAPISQPPQPIVASQSTPPFKLQINMDILKEDIANSSARQPLPPPLTKQEKFTALIGMRNVNPMELRQLALKLKRPFTSDELSFMEAGKKLLLAGNVCISELSSIEKQFVYSTTGPLGSKSQGGAINSVQPETVSRYANLVIKKLAVILMRDEHVLNADLKKKWEIETLSAADLGTSEENYEAALVGILLDQLHGLFVQPTETETGAYAKQLIKYLLVQKNGESISGFDSDSDLDYELDTEDEERIEFSDLESIVIMEPKRAAQVYAALRFLNLAILAIAFKHQQEKNFLRFVESYGHSEFMRYVNLTLGELRNMSDSSLQVNPIVVRDGPKGMEFIVVNGAVDVQGFRHASELLRTGIVNAICGAGVEQELVSELKRMLLGGMVDENKWCIVVSKNQFALSGVGFDLIRAHLSNLAERNVDAFANLHAELNVMVGLLISLEASALLRTKQLFHLHARVDRVNEGSLLLNKGMFGNYSTLEINTVSSKHDGNVDVRGNLTPRVSKITAVCKILFPQVFHSKQVKPKLLASRHLTATDVNKYDGLLLQLSCTQAFELRLKPCELDAFSKLTELGKSNLMHKRSLRKFALALGSKAGEIFSNNALKSGLLRKLLSTFNNRAGDLVNQELTRGGFLPSFAAVARGHLKAIERQIQISGLGDMGAHTSQTQQRCYEAVKQGSSHTLSVAQTSFNLARCKQILFLDCCFETEQLIEPACYELPDAVTAVGKRIGHTLLDFQLKVVEASLSRKDLVFAAGCGSGKTTLAIASAGAMSKGVTVLYTPTVSLKHSMEVTCESLGVPYLSYSRGDRGFPSANNWDDNARVVIVVYDTGLTEGFLLWLWTLNENRLLNRIVFDEAHSLVDQANFRNVMLRMGSIASHIQNVPFSFLSGTFPQCIINYCKRVFKCGATCVEVVQPINLRRWDGVFVEEVNCPLCHNELGTVAAAKIVNELRNLPKFRVIVFVYALELVDTISERIKPSLSDCVVLEASSKHEEDSNANAVGQLLTQSLDRLIVVSTSMLGAGSDFKGVTDVFCVGAHGAMDLVQMFSRCGRGVAGGGRVYFYYHQDLLEGKQDFSFAGDADLKPDQLEFILGRKSVRQLVKAVEQGDCVCNSLERMFPHTENAKCGKCTTCRNSSLVSVKKPRVLQAVEGGIADDTVLVCEYNQCMLGLNVTGRESCLLCSVGLDGKGHFPNNCAMVRKLVPTPKYCNYCYSLAHVRKGKDELPMGCCDLAECGGCLNCGRSDCPRGNKAIASETNRCDTFATFKNVLAFLWFGQREQLGHYFPETLAFKTYRELFYFAYRETFSIDKNVKVNMVRMLGMFWMKRRNKQW